MAPHRLVRDSIAIALSQYVARAVVVARGVAAAAALGPHGTGGWNALNLIFDYGSYATAGAVQGLDLELPAAVEVGDAGRARELMAGAWAAVLVGGALFAAAVAFYLTVDGRAFAATPGWALPALMLFAALGQLVFLALAAALRAHGRIPAVSLAYGVQGVLGGGLGVALVWRYGIAGMLWGWLAGTGAACASMLRGGPEFPFRHASIRAGLGLVRAGFPIFAFYAVTLLLRSIDRLALVRYGTPESLGLYTVGLMVAGSALYVPEALAYVLFPRMAAASQGARDPGRTRAEALRGHRAVTLVLPLLVGLAMVWAEPLIARILPAFGPGVPALRMLCVGALMLGAANVPGYYLLASGARALLAWVGAVAALLDAAIVFAAAARDPRPWVVAAATAVGYALFAAAIVALVARAWFPTARGRAWLAMVSFVPALWVSAAALALCAVGPGESLAAAAARTALLLLAYAPILAWLGRGVGLRGLARAWLGARRA